MKISLDSWLLEFNPDQFSSVSGSVRPPVVDQTRFQKTFPHDHPASDLSARCDHASSISAYAQTTVQDTTYGAGQNVTILGPQTVTTSGTVTVSGGANVQFLCYVVRHFECGFLLLRQHFSGDGRYTTPAHCAHGLHYPRTTPTSFTVNWAASTDPMVGVTSYEVSYNGYSMGTASGTSMNISSVPPNNTALTPSTMYQFAVRATDALFSNTSARRFRLCSHNHAPSPLSLAPSLNNTTVLAGTTINLAAAAGAYRLLPSITKGRIPILEPP